MLVARVVTKKVTLEAPAGTLTDARTVANLAFEELSETVCPPVGVGPVMVTVPVTTAEEPPTTVVGLTVTD